MLPQPNFGPSSEPDDGDEPAGPPKKVGRLRIALWAQALAAILAGNYLFLILLQINQMSASELADSGLSSNPDLTPWWVIVGVTLMCAVISALCAVRLKSRLRAVRFWGMGASFPLFLAGMFMSPIFGYLIGILVFASLFALWWLFSGDVKHWMTESGRK